MIAAELRAGMTTQELESVKMMARVERRVAMAIKQAKVMKKSALTISSATIRKVAIGAGSRIILSFTIIISAVKTSLMPNRSMLATKRIADETTIRKIHHEVVQKNFEEIIFVLFIGRINSSLIVPLEYSWDMMRTPKHTITMVIMSIINEN